MTATATPLLQDGVTVVMPAYKEEENLTSTVEDFLHTLESAGERHRVVVVNDGSPDRTGEVADELAARFPDRVHVVHHEVNRGYGAAVRTGIAAALSETDNRRIFLTDSDGQFKAAQLPDFIAVARSERADAVIGYREKRADPFKRRLNAFLWTLLSMLLVRHGSRDVDCAYKLVDRRLLQDVVLRGEAATISPELLAKIRLNGARIVERPVEHYPRMHGEQTGANLRVVLKSLRGLVFLFLETAPRRRFGRIIHRLVKPREGMLAIVTLAAMAASIAAYVYFAERHTTLDYPDTYSHMMISRRVLFASTPGPAQLGGVWLPLPHLLTLATVWIDSWYFTGFSGSVISMVAYVLTVRYLYRIGYRLTASRIGGLVAALVFGANPGILYMQSTPMTETLLCACIAAATYYLLRWCQNGGYRDLAACAAATVLATLTRYEGWIFALATGVVVLYVTVRKAWRLPTWREKFRRVEANLLFFGFVGVSGIAGWLLWNMVIFKDPMNFQSGSFAKPSLWVPRSEPAINSWKVSIQTYGYALIDDFGLPLLLIGAAGLLWYLFRARLRPETVAPVALLVFPPFFVDALYSAQRPMHVMQINGNLYNVRFGLLIALPLALFAAYLAAGLPVIAKALWRRSAQLTLVGAVLAGSLYVALTGVAALQEAQRFHATASEQANRDAAAWFRAHYNGGLVLMESFGNETVTFDSELPVGNVIYEGSYKQWEPALADPGAHGIRWIYLRRKTGNQDDVATALLGSPALNGYRPVYADQDRIIYYLGASG